MKKTKPTMDTIASQLNISKTTVYRALKNQSGISPVMKEQILSKAAELGYSYIEKNKNISIKYCYIVPKQYFFASEQFYTQIYYYLNSECQVYGYTLDLIIADDTIDMEQAKKYTGVFLSGEFEKKIYKQFQNHKIKTVCIDYFSKEYPFSYVFIESFYSSYYITKHLIDCGHKEIGFIGDIYKANNILNRYLGYERAMLEAHLPINLDWILFQNIADLTNFNQITLPQQLPTAYICYCDMAAKQLYLKLEFLGIKIPDQISVVGFDNTYVATELSPPLTTSGIDKAVIAKVSLSAMRKLVKTYQPSVEYLVPNIIERDSVKTIV